MGRVCEISKKLLVSRGDVQTNNLVVCESIIIFSVVMSVIATCGAVSARTVDCTVATVNRFSKDYCLHVQLVQ